jgi:Spy/CpxP family protein refolding chaperone
MQRSKQQALMFLLGAVLVGGVVGFSAERVFNHSDRHSWADRERMYDDLALTLQQRASMDSALDESNRQREAVLRPIKPALDSIKSTTRTQFFRIFTAEQQAKFLERMREDSLRRELNRQARDQKKK